MSTSSRLLKLLSLLQVPRSWSGGELAERLEVSRRTVRRDIDRLRDLGYAVEGSLGAEGGYRLRAGTAIPPLLLDDDEAVAIAIGLRTAAGHAVDGIDEAAARALAKLEQVLPPRLRSRFEVLRGATGRFDWSGPSVDPGVLTVLATTISTRERLRFTYRAPEGTASRRTVEPNGLVVTGRRWYFVAWDEDREDWRTFRVDRIADPWPTGRPLPRRELPGGVDAATFVRDQQLSLAPTYTMTAVVHAPLAQVAARAGDDGVVEAMDADRSRITIDGDTLEWLAFRLIHLDCDFEILEPPELRAYLRVLARRLVRLSPSSARGQAAT
jgi:predicted DNA-binding transcriptional regulator YafY